MTVPFPGPPNPAGASLSIKSTKTKQVRCPKGYSWCQESRDGQRLDRLSAERSSSEKLDHAGVAKGVRLYPRKIEEFRHAFVMGPQQL
ncbi:hypothetical protein QF038_003814 [Pseudarthrobacter sp. W1I19]|nr:hypothetical protein [Pseudarthrobacter sp. W1I19]